MLRASIRATLALIVAAILAPAGASAAWNQPVGGASPINQSPTENAFAPSLAAIGGVPYVAWAEFDGSNRQIRVSRLNAAGTAWEQVVGGASPINQSSTGFALNPSLTEIGGVPYVAWREFDSTEGNSEIRVARLNAAGTAWEQVVGGASPINQANDQNGDSPSLTAIGGVPYVAWTEHDGANQEIRVSRLNAAGTAWEQVVGGASPINESPTGDAFLPRLTAIGGVPYVAWTEDDGVNEEIRVARLNAAGTDWEQVVGGASPINQSPTATAFDPNLTAIGGVPYIAWNEDDGTNEEIRVARLNGAGTAWEQVVGGASPINEANNRQANRPSLTAIGGVPYVAWDETDGGNFEIRVARLNAAGTAWEQVVGGASPINQSPNDFAVQASLTAIGGVPHVAWREFDGANGETRVSRLQPEFSNASALPTATGATLSVDVNTHGVPYPVGFDHGPGLGSSTTTKTTSSGFETVTRQITGLAPSSAYQFRPFATAGTPLPKVAGSTQAFTTLAADGPGPQGAAGASGLPGADGATGPQGPAGRDALVTCKVKVKKGKPKVKVKCTVTFPSAGARRVKLELVRGGTVYARGATRSGGSVVLDQRRQLAQGRYTLRVTTIDRDGTRFLSESKLGVG